MTVKNTAESILGNIEAVTESGCWIWMGMIRKDGYGSVRFQGKRYLAHRLVHELIKGPIPVGLQPDHLCRVRCCVNPDHEESVVQRINILRGIGPTAINARKTHCLNGHVFDDANTYVTASNGRSCRACDREEYWQTRETVLADRKEYYKKNREKVIQRTAAYRRRHELNRRGPKVVMQISQWELPR